MGLAKIRRVKRQTLKRGKSAKRGRAARLAKPDESASMEQLPAYQSGKRDGFQKGKEDGYNKGRADAAARTTAAEPVVEVAAEPTLDALVIIAGMIPTIEIGIIQPFNAMRDRDGFKYEVIDEKAATRAHIASARHIIFVRNVEPETYRCLEWAHELGRHTVYFIDDNFLEIKPNTEIGLYYNDPGRRETFANFLRNSQTIKVDAPELGKYIYERYNTNTIYFPASVDFAWIDQLSRNYEYRAQLVIGYEGAAKEDDFAPVIPALKRVLDYYGGFVRAEFYGYVPPAIAGHPNVSYQEGGIDYRSFIGKLNTCNWDIGLAPLENNPFNNCKTNNKFREYSACRIAGIYSDSPVYTPWVTSEDTGLIVPHTEEGWYKGLIKMIENPVLRHKIRVQAEAAARSLFSLETCIQNWKTYIFKQ